MIRSWHALNLSHLKDFISYITDEKPCSIQSCLCRRSSDISSVNSWLQHFSEKYAGKSEFSTASNSCSGISGTDSDRGHFRDDVDFLRTCTLFPKRSC